MKQERFDLVIPCSDPVILPLHAHRRDLEPNGKIYLLLDDVFRQVSSKFEVNALARAAGVAVPREKLVGRVEEAEEIRRVFSLPVVLNPRSSCDLDQVGERQIVRRANSWDEFSAALDAMLSSGPVAVQENFIGQGVGVELLLNEGTPLLEFQHIRLHEPLQGGGSTYRKGVAVTPELLKAALAILGPMRYTGVAMVGFKVNPTTGQWVLIEINGRFWGSLPLAIASGVDFPLALYELLVKGRTEFPRGYRLGLCCRYWTQDLHWLAANWRADKSDPTLATQPVARDLREALVNLLTLRERSDTLTRDDPMPGLVEGVRLASGLLGSVKRKLGQRLQALPLVRRRLRLRAVKALRQAKGVLFVCKGNICRSPFAEHLAGQLVNCRKMFFSAGYYPIANRPSPDAAVAAAARLGVDLTGHRSVKLTRERALQADVIVVFDKENFDHVIREFGCRRKVYPLGAFCPTGPLWMDDPYGQSVAHFERTYERIQEALTAALSQDVGT
jgi:protein-tyrosine-phosphatase/predicted ATP-grasp superfamily ATP-dependent carboligase